MKHAHVVAIAVGVGFGSLFITSDKCREAWIEYGITIGQCPDGKVRQTATMNVSALRRGVAGSARISAFAHYTTSGADNVQTTSIPDVTSIELSLVDAKGTATKLPAKWEYGSAQVTLPQVPDGDYKLRAKFATRVGPGELDVPLPLYTPARVHVLTDRPLYEPGNMVQFRAVVLKAKDLAPVDGRPGTWIVKDPEGEVLLEEKAPAGDWGVVAGNFPLDKGARVGVWTVSWQSAGAIDQVSFEVKPFTLPRFRVEATASKPFYRVGETPAIKGAVIYSSGAPVANAQVEITWDIDGAWPPPREWTEKLLPKTAKTAANGRFELALPKIPEDLQGQVSMRARLAAVDAAGDRVEGSSTVLLAKDGIQVSSVTELGDGLVEGFNNRMFVRVTTPDGDVMRNTKIHIKRAWQPNDNGQTVETDIDGVASMQIDPGPAVNVIVPPMPWRPAPKQALVSRGEVSDLIGDEGGSLADQVEMDRWLAAIGPCAKWWDGEDAKARVGMRVAAGGNIITIGGGSTPLDQCVIDTLRGKRLPAGAERMYTVTFAFNDPALSTLTASVDAALETPGGFTEQMSTLAKSTRDCLPQIDGAEGALPMMLTWKLTRGSKDVELGAWIKDPQGGDARAVMPCVTSRINAGKRVKLEEEARQDSLGIVRFSVQLPASESEQRPQATTMLGYELLVTAETEGKPSTKLRVTPGSVPPLRLRVSPVVANPGETITAELIRGPDFHGSLPEKLEVVYLEAEKQEPKLDENRKTTFALQPKAEGWVEVRGAGQRALVYVKPQAELEVTVKPRQERYAPGQKAELELSTKIAGKGGRAAVGLFGVDQSLGQLTTLPGADDMSRVRPKVETSTPAFGTLDGQALALGRIRGQNAAAATVLRVTAIPTPPELDAQVSAEATSRFDQIEELTDNFYTVLAELHVQTRKWEASARPDEKMRPATMAVLWMKALETCAARGEKVTDAYGRKLKLWRLPPDLLSLTDPRAVVVVGTRLPEDVENWAAWVAKERP
ncbi:MAG: MG2 domain-containing protein [Myxococcota bacterium]|nr:MG2 domain-containing protein [Myxococcota bacterium]